MGVFFVAVAVGDRVLWMKNLFIFTVQATLRDASHAGSKDGGGRGLADLDVFGVVGSKRLDGSYGCVSLVRLPLRNRFPVPGLRVRPGQLAQLIPAVLFCRGARRSRVDWRRR